MISDLDLMISIHTCTHYNILAFRPKDRLTVTANAQKHFTTFPAGAHKP